MSISDTISSVAATNPVVGVAVARQSIGSAILSGLTSGDAGTDTGTSALLDAINGQAQTANQLLTTLQPNLGQNVNTTA
jgi:hypothetical protein